MTDPKAPIAPLTKVTLALQTAPSDAKISDGSAPVDFVFVFGIGTGGMTGFEQALLGKTEGDRLCLSIDNCQAATDLEHLFMPLMQTIQTQPPFKLHIAVKSVSPATDRELVRALSQKVESGCGCGCGSDC